MNEERRTENWRLDSIDREIKELKTMVRELTEGINVDRLSLQRTYVGRDEYREHQRRVNQRIERLWSLFWAMVVLLIATMGALIGRMVQGI